jgi:hypothetical protein
MTDKLVLTESESLELLAFLITAARILPEESPDYGPMRLAAAAQRLCAAAGPRTDGEARVLMEHLAAAITPQTRKRNSDPAGFVAFLAESSQAIARVLAHRAGIEV